MSPPVKRSLYWNNTQDKKDKRSLKTGILQSGVFSLHTKNMPSPFLRMDSYTCLSYVANIRCQARPRLHPCLVWMTLAGSFMCAYKGWQREQLPQGGSTWRWHPVVMETNAMLGVGWQCVSVCVCGLRGRSTVTCVSNDVCSTMHSTPQRSSLLWTPVLARPLLLHRHLSDPLERACNLPSKGLVS